MSFLLDTNIVSDIAKKADAGLTAWAASQSPLDLHLSVLSLGEIQKGIDLLDPGDRRSRFTTWLEKDLAAQFAGRLLEVDARTARAYGTLAAAGQRTGRRLPVMDGLILATAQTHALTLVTRNVADVDGRGVPVHSPYTGNKP